MQLTTARPHISKAANPLHKHSFPGCEINRVMAGAPTAQWPDVSSYSGSISSDLSHSLSLPDGHGALYPTASRGPFSRALPLIGSLLCDPR